MKLTTSVVVAVGVLSGVLSSVVSARVTEGMRRSQAPAPAPAAALSVNRPPPSRETLAASTAEHLARHQAAVDAHWREPVDPSWAKEAEASFARGLAAVKTSTPSEFDKVDCRSKTCVADLHFPSYEAERNTFLEYVTHGYEHQCGKELYGPVPEDGSKPYSVTLVLDCSAERGAPPRP
jgi:hypothetical protein